jgi:ElaB/YqjD/DUF883 family membrane-anchored ribosome-binding protein
VDEATRTSGSPVGDEQETRSPEQIRADIKDTREDLGDTVEALASKTDVKGQAKAKVESIKEKVGGAKDDAADRTPDSAQQGFHQVKSTATENPVPTAAIAAFVGGILVGVILARR